MVPSFEPWPFGALGISLPMVFVGFALGPGNHGAHLSFWLQQDAKKYSCDFALFVRSPFRAFDGATYPRSEPGPKHQKSAASTRKCSNLLGERGGLLWDSRHFLPSLADPLGGHFGLSGLGDAGTNRAHPPDHSRVLRLCLLAYPRPPNLGPTPQDATHLLLTREVGTFSNR